MSSRDLSQLRRPARQAFTLIELMVTLGIVIILAALISVASSQAIFSGKSAESIQHLREVGQVARSWSQDHDGRWHSTEDKDGFWVINFWKVVYGPEGRNYPGMGETTHGNRLAGSIFYSPLIEPPADSPVARSFGINTTCLAQSMPSAMWDTLPYPSQTCLAADSKTTSFLNEGQLNFRNRGHANVVYMDGHVGTVAAADVPPWGQGVFWTGQL